MSSLDKLFGRSSPELKTAEDDPIKVGLFGGPFGKMLSSVISPQAIEKMGSDVEAFLNYIREQFNLIIRQNVLVIDQQKLIITQNEEIIALLKGRQENALSQPDAVAVSDEVAGGTSVGAGDGNGGNPRRSRARKSAGAGSVPASE